MPLASRSSDQHLGGWPGVFAVAAVTFVMVTSEFLPIGLLTDVARDLGVTQGRAGLMVTAPGCVAAVAAPLIMARAGRVDRRTLLLLLTGLIVLADLVAGFARTLPQILAGRLLLGAALGGIWALAVPAGRRLVDEASGNRATALVLGGISIGTVVGVPLGTLAGEMVGWRAAFLIVAGAACAVLAAQVVLLPSLPGTGSAGFGGLVRIARDPMVRVGYLAAAFVAAGHFAAYTYLQPFLTGVVKVDGAALTGILAVYGVAGVVGTWLGERCASRDVARTFMAVALTVSASIALSIMSDRSVWTVVLGITLWGAGFGALPVTVQIWTYRASPEGFEAGSALLVTVFQIAVATGAFLGGLAADASGIPLAFGMGAASSLTAAAILLACRGRLLDPAAEAATGEAA